MSARIYRFPRPYPRELDGVAVYRVGDTWVLRREHEGHVVEMHGLQLADLRDLGAAINLVLSVVE